MSSKRKELRQINEKVEKPTDAVPAKALPAVKPTASRRAAGCNWSAASQTDADPKPEEKDAVEEKKLSASAKRRQKRKANQDKYVAMDCEMVGVGSTGTEDMLARVSIVDLHGEILLDKYVKPTQEVKDYRTKVSGIRQRDIEDAADFASVQSEVVEILRGKYLVGHGIVNDLAVLHIKHPFAMIRDTARYKPLSLLVSNGRTPSLKRLSEAILGVEIQTGEHNSVEDAKAAMSIYNRLKKDWEWYILQRSQRKRK